MTQVIYYKFNPHKTYKFGCVICCYNRESFVKDTINSISKSFLPQDLLFIIIDDGSNPVIQVELDHDYILIRKDKNYGISNSLAIGWDIAYILNIEYLMNLDSDTNVSVNWLSRLLSTSKKFNDNAVVTGFNGRYHSIINDNKNYYLKNSIGGINIWFEKTLYQQTIRKSLTTYDIIPNSIDKILLDIDKYGVNPKIHDVYNGWDWGLVSLCNNQKIEMVCVKPSVVQHIGKRGLNSKPNNIEKSLDYQNICVPKIIHQLWKDNNIPEHLRLMQKSVLNNHPTYEYKLWTDELLIEFIRQFYPNILDYYQTGIEHIIQQIDFVRLLLLYHYGGVYIDIDSFCINPVDDILNYPCSFINTKKHEAFSDNYYPLVLNNAFIAAEKDNHFIQQILIHIIEYNDPVNYKEYCSFNPAYTKILKSAGPLCITDVYLNYSFKSCINLLSSDYYFGSSYDKKMTANQILEYGIKVSHNIKNCHFIHLHESSWWKDDNDKAISPPTNKFFTKENIEIKKNMAKLELI